MTQTLMLSVNGMDQPGISRTLFNALPAGLEVLDIEQVVVDGFLQLGVVLRVAGDTDVLKVIDVARATLSPLGLTVSSTSHSEHIQRRAGIRHRVSVMGSPLRSEAVANLTEAIKHAGGNIERVEQVASEPVTAIQFKIYGADIDSLKTGVGDFARKFGADVAIQKLNLDRRGRQLVVMDVDSTVIQNEVIELIAAHAGVEAEVKRITDAAMAGELDFEQSLRARAKLLAGLPESVFADVYKQVVLTPGAKRLCTVLNHLGYEIALVSGGFTEVVKEIAAELGVSHFRANELEVIDGKLTGALCGEIVDRPAKAKYLKHFADLFGIPLSRTIAIGDGANDLDMLQVAGLGLAFNAKPVVQQNADAAINVPYLDTALFLMGITKAEIDSVNLDLE